MNLIIQLIFTAGYIILDIPDVWYMNTMQWVRSKHREILVLFSPGTVVFNISIKEIKKSKDLTWMVQCLPFQPVTQRQVPFLH